MAHNFQAQWMSATQLKVTWQPALVRDAALVRMVIDTAGYPSTPDDAIAMQECAPDQNSCLFQGLNSKCTYYVSPFIQDRNGTWTDFSTVLDNAISIGPVEGYTITRDVPYGTDKTGKQKLDLYVPHSGDNLPTVLFVHGGAWKSGNRRHWERICRYFAKNGVACASASYRLIPESPFPANICDVRLAMSWLKSNGSRFRMNTERICAAGSSAGGHLVMLLSTIAAGDTLGLSPGMTVAETRPWATVAYNPGGANFVKKWVEKPDGHADLIAMMGASYDTNPALYVSASPALRFDRNMPPVLFIYGSQDITTPLAEGKVDYIEPLVAVGGTPQLLVCDGMPHGFGYVLRVPEQVRAAETALRFILQQVHGTGN